jgi:hypothetical protein
MAGLPRSGASRQLVAASQTVKPALAIFVAAIRHPRRRPAAIVDNACSGSGRAARAGHRVRSIGRFPMHAPRVAIGGGGNAANRAQRLRLDDLDADTQLTGVGATLA